MLDEISYCLMHVHRAMTSVSSKTKYTHVITNSQRRLDIRLLSAEYLYPCRLESLPESNKNTFCVIFVVMYKNENQHKEEKKIFFWTYVLRSQSVAAWKQNICSLSRCFLFFFCEPCLYQTFYWKYNEKFWKFITVRTSRSIGSRFKAEHMFSITIFCHFLFFRWALFIANIPFEIQCISILHEKF